METSRSKNLSMPNSFLIKYIGSGNGPKSMYAVPKFWHSVDDLQTWTTSCSPPQPLPPVFEVGVPSSHGTGAAAALPPHHEVAPSGRHCWHAAPQLLCTVHQHYYFMSKSVQFCGFSCKLVSYRCLTPSLCILFFIFAPVQCNWACFTWKGTLEIRSLLLLLLVNTSTWRWFVLQSALEKKPTQIKKQTEQKQLIRSADPGGYWPQIK